MSSDALDLTGPPPLRATPGVTALAGRVLHVDGRPIPSWCGWASEGHALTHWADFLAGATDGVGLGPVAVIPSHQRRGIGSRLIREGLAACQQSGFGFVVVLGEPGYYGRFGFAPASC